LPHDRRRVRGAASGALQIGMRGLVETACGAVTNPATPPAVTSIPANCAPVGRSPSSTKVATSDSSGIYGTTMAVVRARSRRVMAAYHSIVPT